MSQNNYPWGKKGLVQCLTTIFKSPHQLEIQKWQRFQLAIVAALGHLCTGQRHIFVQADGNRRFSPSNNTILQLPSTGRLPSILEPVEQDGALAI